MTTPHAFRLIPGARSRPRNRLLAALPEPEFARLAPAIEVMVVRARQVMQQAGEDVRHVYFPNEGMFAVASVQPDGSMTEAASVGDEGLLGIEAFFADGAPAAGETVAQGSEASVARLETALFRREMERGGALYALADRYVSTFVAQTMQLAACHALHRSEQRFARWLLLADDRLRHGRIPATHEDIAMMLGTRRQTVTVAAGAFQRASLIAASHGCLTVIDRAGLEATACPCYALIQAQLARLSRAL